MTTMLLHDHAVLTFDCYGTLIDWERGMIDALAPLTSRVAPTPSRDEILAAHARLEASQQRWTPARPYAALLATAYKRMAEEWGVNASAAEAEAYGASVGDWPAFADTVEALAYLKGFFRLAILSNVDNRSFEGSRKRLGDVFDAIYTAEDIGSYKPNERNFAYLIERLGERGVARGEILHVAESLYHDHAPAQALGLRTCWIHRRHAQGGYGATIEPSSMPSFNWRFGSLAELVDAHRHEAKTARGSAPGPR